MIDVRPANDDEMGAIGSLAGYVYGGLFGDGPETLTGTANRPEWTLCAFDGDRLASSFVTIPFTMRMNGRSLAMGGVTGVATHPEYRRQGLMRRLMTQATAEMRDRGQPVAALWASQAAIYQRFGYAIGSGNRSYRVDTADVGFFDGDGGGSQVEWLSAAEGFDLVKPLYIDFVANRSGYLHRSKTLWELGVLAADDRDGPVHVALSRDESGVPNGYLVYTLRGDRVDHRSRAQELIIRDFGWLSLDAYRSLWSYIARHDLVGRVVWTTAPVDDPAEEIFTEPRMLHRQDTEGVWFRVVDVAAALMGRGFSTAGQTTITVTEDDVSPWNAGTYSVETDGAETAVERITYSGSTSATMTIKALGSLYCGMRSARQLRAWGLIEATDEAVDGLDGLFATHHRPHSPDHF